CTDFLVLADLGLPGLVNVPFAGRMTLPPIAISARSRKSSVSSGASSGSCQTRLVLFLFSVIALPHRDNVAIFTAWCPDNGDQPSPEQPKRDPPRFAIVEPVVFE